MKIRILIVALLLSFCNDSLAQSTSTEERVDTCINLIKGYSRYWLKDSLAENGFRELLATQTLVNCTYKGRKWKQILTYLGKPDFVISHKETTEYRYRLNRHSEDIKHPGTLLLAIKVDNEGIVASFIVLEVDG